MRNPDRVGRIGLSDGHRDLGTEPCVVHGRRVRPAQRFGLVWTSAHDGVGLVPEGIDFETRHAKIVTHVGSGGVEVSP